MTSPSACDLYDKAISLGGMSKTYGMGGLRIGWVVTKDKSLLEKMESLKDYTSSCCSASSEILSLIAIRARDVIHRDNLEAVQANIVAAENFFERWPDLFYWVLLTNPSESRNGRETIRHSLQQTEWLSLH
jgi:aspartate/methionine/tyrosine aminotransferase